jgi:hypothetical protein
MVRHRIATPNPRTLEWVFRDRAAWIVGAVMASFLPLGIGFVIAAYEDWLTALFAALLLFLSLGSIFVLTMSAASPSGMGGILAGRGARAISPSPAGAYSALRLSAAVREWSRRRPFQVNGNWYLIAPYYIDGQPITAQDGDLRIEITAGGPATGGTRTFDGVLVEYLGDTARFDVPQGKDLGAVLPQMPSRAQALVVRTLSDLASLDAALSSADAASRAAEAKRAEQDRRRLAERMS